MLRKLIDKENEEIERQRKEEQQRLIKEASLKYKSSEEHSMIRSIPQMISEIYRAAQKFTHKLLNKDHELMRQVINEENTHKTLSPSPSNENNFSSIFTSLYQDHLDSSLLASLSPSFTKFKLEQMFIVLVSPHQALEKYFKQLDESSLKKEFKKLALLLHPDKNPSSYAKVAFNKIFSIYESSKNSSASN